MRTGTEYACVNVGCLVVTYLNPDTFPMAMCPACGLIGDPVTPKACTEDQSHLVAADLERMAERED